MIIYKLLSVVKNANKICLQQKIPLQKHVLFFQVKYQKKTETVILKFYWMIYAMTNTTVD